MPKTFLIRKRACSRRLWSEFDSDTDDDTEVINNGMDKDLQSDREDEAWISNNIVNKHAQLLNDETIEDSPHKDKTSEGMIDDLEHKRANNHS